MTTTIDYLDSAIKSLIELKGRIENNSLIDSEELRAEARIIDNECDELNFKF